ncbi:microtubule-associated protein futsch-like [Drosophila ficusphila]|uniref:microtubule-associated protein futsch-like n=1 Tax=Drosophila ficusphila TaxID=30025 RepID=UPI001C89BFFB|nr:microtubule-associated protein futsch-like [Drosophila ficusphila]
MPQTEHFSVHSVKPETFTKTDEPDKLLHSMVALPDIQKLYSQDTTSFTEMSTSSQTPKMTTTTTLTAQIDRTKVDLTIPEQDQLKKELKEKPSVDVNADAEKTASDREYLEHIMGCGDVRREIMRLESSGSTESLESIGKQPTLIPKYIGENVPVVRQVVQSIEDKICSTAVSAIPFAVQKRQPNEDIKESDVVELEKQILTPADLALEKLIKCELPVEVVKLSPIEAMENVGLGLKEIEEEVCEKVCEKRKAFVVAEDLCETEKTLTEQVIDLNRQVEQVPGKILTETVEKHLDLEDMDRTETLPKVREVVQDIERRYPIASLEAKPFSPRKRVILDRKADVLSIEQQILSDADLILDGLGSKRLPEQKVHSPVSSAEKPSSSTENLEDVCEKKCSKRTISDMAKVFERQQEAETSPFTKDDKSATAMFLEHEINDVVITKGVKEFRAKSILHEDLTGIADSQIRFLTECDKQEFPTEFIKDTKVVEFPKIAHTLERLHSISKTDIADTRQFVHVANIHEAKMDKLVEHRSQVTALKGNQNLEKDIHVKFPTNDTSDELQTSLVSKTVVSMTDNTQNRFPSEMNTNLDKVKVESDSDEELDNLRKASKLKHLSKIEDRYILDATKVVQATQKSELTKFPAESVKPSRMQYSDDENDEQFEISKPQDKLISQPAPLVAPSISAGDKSPVKPDEKPKSVELKDDKIPTELDKPKSKIESVKPSPLQYSDDESDDEEEVPKPQDKPVGVIPFTGAPDKSPLKEDTKPREVISFKAEESSTTIQTNIKSVSTIVDSVDSQASKPFDPFASLKDEQVPAKQEDKPKSPAESVKPTPTQYSDDESDGEFGISKPQDKLISQPAPLVAPLISAGDKSPVKPDEKPKSVELKDDKIPTELDKPKATIESVKPSPLQYSDDESDDEEEVPKPQDKPVGVIPFTGAPDKSPLKEDTKPREVISFKAEESSTTIQTKIKSVSTIVDSIDSQASKPFDPFASIKDEQVPSKQEDKPKSPAESVKPTPTQYSDDESDEEFGISKPQDKPISQPAPLVAPSISAGDKSPVKPDEKPKMVELKDDKIPTELDKPKSTIESVKPSPLQYSDDESDDEEEVPKPQDKPVGVIPFTGAPYKSPLKEDTKPREVISFKAEESSTTIQTKIKSVSTIVDSVDSQASKPFDPFASLKDEQVPAKQEDKPKSPAESVKPTPTQYSDDESDGEFGISKPQDKPISQPAPLVAPSISAADKSPVKPDEKPKSVELKDDKIPTELDKPKATIESVKPSPLQYSDDESDDEEEVPKPQDKPVGVIPFTGAPDKSPLKEDTKPREVISFKAEESSTTIQTKIKSVSTIVDSIDSQASKPFDPFASIKDEQVPSKQEDKPKSPAESVKPTPTQYSDDESDEEFGISKPQDKPISQPAPLVAPSISAGDKSPVKPDEKPKMVELKDDKIPTELDKPKSTIESVKPSPLQYSDDESDDEEEVPKPQDKPVGVIPFTGAPYKSPLKEDTKPREVISFKAEESSTTIQTKIKSVSNIVDSVDSQARKPFDPFASLKDEQVPAKQEDKPKSPAESVKPTPTQYSDDESDGEFGISKPQDKPISQPAPLVAPSISAGDKSPVKPDEKPKMVELKDDKIPTELDKPKSTIESVKPSPLQYSDDESDDEEEVPKPQDKPVGVIPFTGAPYKSPLKEDTKPREVISFKAEESSTTIQTKIKSVSNIVDSVDSQASKPFDPFASLKDEQVPAKQEDKPKSPAESVKPTPTQYSDDESDGEFGISKPQDKPISQPAPLVAPSISAGDKSPVKPDEKPKSVELKDDKIPTELDKPKSTIESVKPSPLQYSDDESDNEEEVPKPQDKRVGIIPFTGAPDKYPLKEDTKPREVISFKAEESSTTIQTNIKSVSTIVDSVDNQASKPFESFASLKDEQVQTKQADKPKSPAKTVKPTSTRYSDDESDEEFGISKPQDKPISQPAPLVAPSINAGDKSPVKPDEKPKSIELKDDKIPTELDKPKSIIESVKPSPQQYSDDESDDEEEVPKPQDKPVGVIPFTGAPDKSPFKKDTKPREVISFKAEESSTTIQTNIKSVSTIVDSVDSQASKPFDPFASIKDEQVPSKQEDKPKSPAESVKPTPTQYSDDESDEEFGISKPQDKPISQPAPLVAPSISAGDKSPVKPDEKPKSVELKDDKIPTELDKPKSTIESVKPSPLQYSDDESDDEEEVPKPQDKPVGVIPFTGAPDNSPLKEDTKPREVISFKAEESSTTIQTNIKSVSTIVDSVDSQASKPFDPFASLKDEQVPTKQEDKPKSPAESVKPTPTQYSDDESDEEFGISKPQDKPVSQPAPLVAPSISAGDKSPVKPDEKPKSVELKDDKIPTELDKPKLTIESVKPSPLQYSDDESDDEDEVPKPQDKPVGVIPFTGAPDKSPLKEDTKPREVISFKAEESSTTIQTNIKSVSTIVDSVDSQASKPFDPFASVKDEQVPTKQEDKPKSPAESVKPTSTQHSDDESDEEDGISKPHDKPVSQPAPLVAPSISAGDKSPVKPDEKPKSVELKDDKIPTELDKPKSTIESVKPSPLQHSDDESDNEEEVPKPHDKPVGVIPFTGAPDKSPLKEDTKPREVISFKAEESSTTIQTKIKSVSTIVDSVDSQASKPFDPFASVKDEQVPTKQEDKPKSPAESVKPTPTQYSDDESDEELGISKPQDKPVSQPAPFVAPSISAGDKSPVKPDEKPKSVELKDDKIPTELDKPKSTIESVKPSPLQYSDDESDDEDEVPKPQDKPVGEIPFTGAPDKSPLKEDTKPREVISFKAEESSTTIQTNIKSVSTIVDSVDSQASKPFDPFASVKDEQVPTKQEDKPKSPAESVKPTPTQYSDDESDGEFGISKPQDKPISQPAPLVAPSISSGDKSPVKPDEKPKSVELKDDKIPTELDKPKSTIESVKPSPLQYSDDESDDEEEVPKPQDKPVGVIPFTGAPDKSPLKEDTKPREVISFKAEESSTTIQTNMKSVSTIVDSLDSQASKPFDPFASVKDDQVPTKQEDKPKSPAESVKPTPMQYSDDESDEEFEISKPQDKPFSQPAPLVAPLISAGDKSPVKPNEKPKSVELKDDKIPTELDKPKSTIESVKPSPLQYSDDESDDEEEVPKPQDKPVGVIPFTGAPDKSPLKEVTKPREVISFKAEESSTTIQTNIKSVSTIVDSVDSQASKPFDPFASIKDEQVPTKQEDKPKSPAESVKPSPTQYSDDESDEEFGISKPHDKPVSQPAPLVAPLISAGDKSPVKPNEKPKSVELKDDKIPTELDKPKSTIESVKPSPLQYSDDESDDEEEVPKPQDKPVGVIPFTGAPDKSPLKEDTKPREVISFKAEESSTTIQTNIKSVSTIVDSVDSQASKPFDPFASIKDEQVPSKQEDKPKSPAESVKPSPTQYSDDESDEEFGISKPQDKPVSQPAPLVAPSINAGDKSPVKPDEEPKSVELKDDKIPTELDKPKSTIESVKPSPLQYSDDESDDEEEVPKPQDKPVGVIPFTGAPDKSPLKEDTKPREVISFKAEESSTTIQTNIKSVSTIVDSVDSQASKPFDPFASIKDEQVPSKQEDKPKSPAESVKPSPTQYSDDESDEEFGISKPQDKPVSQPAPLVAPLISAGDKSPVKPNEKPKSVELKDDKIPTELDKPKSTIESVKPSPLQYSDDESDDEEEVPKPQDKPVGVIPFTGAPDKSPLKEDTKPREVISFKAEESSTTIQTNIKSVSTIVDSVDSQASKPFDPFASIKDEQVPSKQEDKPKSPAESVKPSPTQYSDDESDEEFGISKPQDKPISQPAPLVAPSINAGDKSPVKPDEEPKSVELKDDKIPTELDKPKSTIESVKPSPLQYSDDESDDEEEVPKPQDKPVGVIPFTGAPDKSPLKEDTKPREVISFKAEESSTTIQTKVKSVSTIVDSVDSQASKPFDPFASIKDEQVPSKQEDKPKSPAESVKPSPTQYSDDESDEEFGISKPQDKPISQPAPLVAPSINAGDKSPVKPDEEPKSVELKDDKIPTELDKPKSTIESVTPSPLQYSGDESDDEEEVPKPQYKPVGVIPFTGAPDKSPLKEDTKPREVISFKAEESSTTIQTNIKSVSTIVDSVDSQASKPFDPFASIKDEQVPSKQEDKPKSPAESVKPSPTQYSDDESDEEFGISKPQDKPISQPAPLVAPSINAGDKSPVKPDEEPKSVELKDDKIPTELDKPKSTIESVKPSPLQYSDDESDDEEEVPKPQDKPVGVIPFTGAPDKSPLKEDTKPREVISFKAEESSTTIQTNIKSVSTIVDSVDSQASKPFDPFASIKDEQVPSKQEDKPKSPAESVKPSPTQYSDDESDEEFGISKPQDKPISQPAPLVAPSINAGDKSPVKPDEEPKSVELKDDKIPTELDKPKSTIESVTPSPLQYSGDESDDEEEVPKPQDKPVGVIPFTGAPDKSPLKEDTKPREVISFKAEESSTTIQTNIKSVSTIVDSVDSQASKPFDPFASIKDEQVPSKQEDKPKSPAESVKPSPTQYSDDESDEEFGISKPQDKPISQPAPLVAPSINAGDKSPVKPDEEPKSVELKDDKIPTELDKNKSTIESVKPSPLQYSDDESDDEEEVPKPQDKPVGVIPFTGAPDKSPLKEDTKPREVISFKAEESSTTIQTNIKSVSTIVDSVDSQASKPFDPFASIKDEQVPSKQEDKPKSPAESVKPTPTQYSDDESDEEFGISKPQDKPISQPAPLVAPSISAGDKSPVKPDEKPKSVELKDDKIPTELDKPKSTIESVKPSPLQYSDDESDNEEEVPKPQDKPVGIIPFTGAPDKSPLKEVTKPREVISFKAEESSTTIQTNMKSVSTIVDSVDSQATKPFDPLASIKDEQVPSKQEDKPKSPAESVKPTPTQYSDDESDEEFGISKPQDKPISQPAPLVAPSISAGDKSPVKPDEKPKSVELKDDKIPTELDKPKSTIESVKPSPLQYSDDESDDEEEVPKPQDKPVGVIPFTGAPDKSPLKEDTKPREVISFKAEESSTTIQTNIKSVSTIVDSVDSQASKPFDPFASIKDEQVPSKQEDKPKSPAESVKPSPTQYSDDESDEEFGISKPQDKPISQPAPLVAPSISAGDKSPVKPDEKPKSVELKDDKIPTELDKPKSTIESVKPSPLQYSDDESDDEEEVPKPQDKPVGVIPFTGAPDKSPLKEVTKPREVISFKAEESSTTIQTNIKSVSTIVDSVDSQASKPFDPFASIKDEQVPSKQEDKPKSPAESVKPTPTQYSDDESDEEFGISKPQDKPISQPAPLVAPSISAGDKSPVKPDEKPKSVELKDDKIPTELDKPKSTIESVKPSPLQHSDDESDDEEEVQKPQDKPVGVIPFTGAPDKSPLKEDTKPREVISFKAEESSTTIQTKVKSVSTIVDSVDSQASKPFDPFASIKDKQVPTKQEDKPKSPAESVKPTPTQYSDDESDEEFGISKPQDKPISQPAPLVAPSISAGDKSPVKPDEKPKSVELKDDKIPTELDKPKSTIESVKPSPLQHSDDESDDEEEVQKPQDKPVGVIPFTGAPDKSPLKEDTKPREVISFKAEESSTTIQTKVKSVSTIVDSVDSQASKPFDPFASIKDKQVPTKQEDKPKSPAESVKPTPTQYSDDESDEEFGISKPQDKPISQPAPLVAPSISAGDKSPVKPDEKPKSVELKDDKIPTELDKPKSTIESVKPSPLQYSDDESDDEEEVQKPQDKPVGVIPFTGAPDKSPLKEVTKPREVISFKAEESSTTIQTNIKSVSTIVDSVDSQASKPFDPFASIKDEQVPTKQEDKPKSPAESVKPSPTQYSDDESDEEFGISKPQDNPISQPAPLVAPSISAGDKSPVKPDEKPKLVELKDDKIPTELDKPKSTIESVKPSPLQYSDDESDDEEEVPKPQDKPVGVIPFTGAPDKSPLKEDTKPREVISFKAEESSTTIQTKVKSVSTIVDSVDSQASKPFDPFASIKDEQVPTKQEDKPKSPAESVKPSPTQYSDDESDEEFGISKPQDNPISQPAPLVAPSISAGDKSPVKPDEKPKLVELKDDKIPTELDKPKSTIESVKPSPLQYSDDESDDEKEVPKPQDKPVGVIPFTGAPDKSPLKEDTKPREVISFKAEESSTTIQTNIKSVSTIVDSVDSQASKPFDPFASIKDEQVPTKQEDKPKSPAESVKPSPTQYSDDESDEEFGISKPQDKPISQPAPLVAPSISAGDKSPIKPDEKPKSVELKDDKIPTELDKPKSTIESVKPSPLQYSDDESDDEEEVPKPQDKPVGVIPFTGAPDKSPLKEDTKPKEVFSFKAEESSTTIQTNIKSVSTIVDSVDSQASKPFDSFASLKDEQVPTKQEDKPKSPAESVKPTPTQYSDDESDEEFGISKPQDKPISQPAPLVAPSISAGDKSPVKPDEKPKSVELKDDKIPTELDKPKSTIESAKPSPLQYSHDESDDEEEVPKPQDKPVGVIPLKEDTKTREVISFKAEESSTTIQTNIKSVSTIVDSVDSQASKPFDPFASLKDEQIPTKQEDKPKTPAESVKPTPTQYSDDESDEEFGISKPQDKPISQPAPLVAPSISSGDKSPVKPDEKPKSVELKDDKIPTELDKPKSTIESVKPSPLQYSDDESDNEEEVPKPHDKPVGVIPFTGAPDKSPLKEDTKPKEVISFKAEESSTTIQTNIKSVSTIVDSVDSQASKPFDPFASIKAEQDPTKQEDKLKSPAESVKPTPTQYSDDESDEEFGISKPQDNPISQPAPLVAPSISAGDKCPVKPDEKPKSVELKDDKIPTEPHKPKSTIESVKPSPLQYSDDESDNEEEVPKPHDKPVGVIPFTGAPDKSPLKEDTKPKEVISFKAEESSTTIQTNIKSVSTIVDSVDSQASKPFDPFASVKDEQVPTKQEDKPKSPAESVKPTPTQYSDDESDEEFGISKPQDNPIGDKSPVKPDEKPKSVELKDDKIPTELDKPKSTIESVKPSPLQYSDDESDDEEEVPNPQAKPVKSHLKENIGPREVMPFKAEESSTTIQANIISVSTIVDSVESQVSKPLKDYTQDPTTNKSMPIKQQLPEDRSDIISYCDENRSVQQIVEDTIRAGDAEVQKIVDETLKSVQHTRNLVIVKDQCVIEGRSVEQIVEETLKNAKLKPNISKKMIMSPQKDNESETKEVRPVAYFVELDNEQKSLAPVRKPIVKATQQKGTKKESGKIVSEVKTSTKTSVSKRTVGVKDKSKVDVKPPSISQTKVRSTPKRQTPVRKTTATDKTKAPQKTESRRSVTSSTSTTTSSASATSRVISELHFERSASPASSSIFYESHPHGDGSRSTTPRPRVKTDVTQIPYNASTRSFSPKPKTIKSEKTTFKQTKTTATRSTKELTEKSSKKTDRVGSQEYIEKRKTPTPSATHRYMQPTLAHSMRYGLSGDGDIGHNLSLAPQKSPVPPKSPAPAQLKSSQNTHLKKSALTKSTSQIAKQSNMFAEKKPIQPRSQIKRGSQSDSKESLKSTDRLYKRETSKENKLTNVIGSKSQATKSMRTQSANSAKTLAYKTSIETDNKLQKKTTATIQQRTKVPISVSSSARTAAKLSKSDDTDKRPQVDNKKTLKRTVSKASEGSVTSSTISTRSVQSSMEPKLQKKMKDSMNETSSNSGSGTTSASGSSNSTRRSVRSVSTVSRKTDKDLTNIRRAAGAVVSTSTVRVHREPTATTGAVSTVLVDDDCEVITIRSIKSSDSTKSSTSSSSGSGSNSRKVLTSEVFTKTFGPDKPLEVVYRQPEFDVEHHTIMSVRPPSTSSDQQRCINEFDVSFIDTTDSSLSDSVALPMFGSGDPERLLAASPGSPKPTRSPLALIEETLRRQQQHHHQHQQYQHSSVVQSGAGALDPPQPMPVPFGESQREAEVEVEKSSTSRANLNN